MLASFLSTAPLRSKPLFLASGDNRGQRAIVLDPGFMLDKMIYGPIWDFPCGTKSERRRLLQGLGDAFEKYISKLFRVRYGGLGPFGADLRPVQNTTAQICDFYYYDPTTRRVLFFEAKSAFLPDQPQGDDAPATFQDALDRRYVFDEKENARSGVSQLAYGIGQVLKGEWSPRERFLCQFLCQPDEIYPMLLCRDSSMSFYTISAYLFERMKEYMRWADETARGWQYRQMHASSKIIRIAPLIVLTVDDIEVITEPRNPAMLEIIADYDLRHPNREVSFHNYRVESPKYAGMFYENEFLVGKKATFPERLGPVFAKWGVPREMVSLPEA